LRSHTGPAFLNAQAHKSQPSLSPPRDRAGAGVAMRGATLPLPGGAPGSTLELRPLLCGEAKMPSNWFERKPGPMETLKAFGVGVPKSQLARIPIPAYLIEHPQAGMVLVDTGMDASIAESGRERARNLGLVGLMMSRHSEMQPEQTAAAQLQAIGIDPRDIGLVVMTHLHFDHASALRDFPNATVLVDEREWGAAHARDSFLNGYTRAQLDPSLDYRMLDFKANSAIASGAFERTLDLWGDGSLTLASTPGHTAGHLSLIVRLREGEALLAADAAYTLQTIRAGERPWLTHDSEAFERSLGQIQAYDRENPDAIVIPGHDMKAWIAACERLASRA
jgi:N-acyl homoserine lactone hydrolase